MISFSELQITWLWPSPRCGVHYFTHGL